MPKVKTSTPIVGLRASELTKAMKAIQKAGQGVERVEITGDRSILFLVPGNHDVVESKPLLTIKEACSYGAFGRTVAYELIKSGKLRTKKLGTRTLIARESIDAFHKHLKSKGRSTHSAVPGHDPKANVGRPRRKIVKHKKSS